MAISPFSLNGLRKALFEEQVGKLEQRGVFGAIKPDECEHKWRQYEGFTERYDYCAKCDVKADAT